jgi:DNA polymerase-3 subunit gamma/tau
MTSSPCGVCRSCLAIDRDQHTDILEFDAASRTGVDDIRDIIDGAQYMPILKRYKIFIIDEVHMLSKSAFNALLKTLEEPPSHVKFIFATTEVRKIPETIISRCMTFQLSPVSSESISGHLIKIAQSEGGSLEKEAADIIAESSEGAVRDSLSILEQAIMLADDSKSVSSDMVISILGSARVSDIEALLHSILSGKTKDSLESVENLINNGGDPFSIYKGLQSALYRRIVDSVKGDVGTLSNLLYIWQILMRQTDKMKFSDSPEKILNAAIIIAAHTAAFPKIEDLFIDSGTIDTSGKLIDDVLSKFQGASAFEVE